jgi:transposase
MPVFRLLSKIRTGFKMNYEAVYLNRILLTSALFPPERSNVQATDRRRIMEHYRSAFASSQAPTQEESRAATRSVRPCRTDRDHFRAALGDSLEDAAAGDGLRIRIDLLEAPAGMAQVRGMETPAPGAAFQTSPGRAHRLLAGGSRQLLHPSLGCWKKTGPNPTDRRRPGSKHHILIDAQGIPLSAILTKANRHDVTQLLPLVDAIPPIAGKRGAPRRKPKLVQADRGYDSDPHRAALLSRGIESQIARRRTKHGSGLGKTRWVVERSIAWLHWFRRLRIRYERLPSMHEAFLKIGCCLICWRFIQRPQSSF